MREFQPAPQTFRTAPCGPNCFWPDCDCDKRHNVVHQPEMVEACRTVAAEELIELQEATIATLRVDLQRATDECDQQRERAERALKALRFVEWVPVMSPVNRQWCPCCQQPPELGHREKCMLKAALTATGEPGDQAKEGER